MRCGHQAGQADPASGFGFRAAGRAWSRNATGVAAIEFSLIVPILLVLLIGCLELVNGIENWRKVVLVTRTAADLTSQGDLQNPISDDTMANIYAATSAVLAPFDISTATINLSAMGVGVKTSSLVRPYVCSSWSNGSAPRAIGLASDLTVPPNYQRQGARYILAEVTMPYVPILGTALAKLTNAASLSLTWRESVAWPVRGGVSYASTTDSEIILKSTSVPTPSKCPG